MDQPTTPLIIAHRGNSLHAPENTAVSIRSAIAAGADLVEFDVRQTSDGELILFHDKDLRRITGSRTSIEQLTFAVTQELDVGTWFDPRGMRFAGERAPTLCAAILLCLESDLVPLIERKSGSAIAYVETLRELNAEERVIVQSFDWEFLAEIRELAPSIRIGALGDKRVDGKMLAALGELRPDWVGWNYKYLKQPQVQRFQSIGAKVAAWTVNEPAGWKQLTQVGVDGIITDQPREARDVLEE